MAAIEIKNKADLLEETSQLESKVNTLSSYVDELKSELNNNIQNVDGMNFAGKAGMIKNSLENALADLKTVSKNISSYATQVNAFDKNDFIVSYRANPLSSNFSTVLSSVTIPEGLGKIHTYMGWQIVKKEGTPQYQLREAAGMNFDSEGFGIIDGRYVVSVTTTIGKIGDYIDVVQEDGSVLHCIIGYNKNQNDEGCNEWGHSNGQCVLEFVVDKDMWYGNAEHAYHTNPGNDSCHPEWRQNITRIDNLGNYFDLHDTTTSEEIKEIPSSPEVHIEPPIENETSAPIVEPPVLEPPIENEASAPIVEPPVLEPPIASNDAVVDATPIPETVPIEEVVPPVLETPVISNDMVAGEEPIPEVIPAEAMISLGGEDPLAVQLMAQTRETPMDVAELGANETTLPSALANIEIPEKDLDLVQSGWWDVSSPAFSPELSNAVPGLDLSVYHNRVDKKFIVTTGHPIYEVSQSDFQLLCAIVTAEADKYTSYDECLAVISTILNRCESTTWINKYNSSDPIVQATAHKQFVVYEHGTYKPYMDKPRAAAVKAVSDALMGVRNHNYLSFRGNGSTYSDNKITPDGNCYK